MTFYDLNKVKEIFQGYTHIELKLINQTFIYSNFLESSLMSRAKFHNKNLER